MEDLNRLQSGKDTLTLPASEADRLLALRSGECALLYVYYLRTGERSVSAAARELGLPEERVRDADARLRRAGLPGNREKAPLPAEELPQVSSEEIADRSRTDPAFSALVREFQQVMGKTLSGNDLRTVYGIYDNLGMPAEVIMLMAQHCAERLRKRYGEGRLPTMRALEQEAYYWSNRGILTPELAEEFLEKRERQEQESEKLLSVLQISGRQPSKTERDYMDKWLEMGYTSETLAEAYDRTVTATGRLAWSYMDKIVQSWYSKQLFTPAEVEKGDPRGGKSRAQRAPAARPAASSSAPAPAGTADDRAILERILGNGR